MKFITRSKVMFLFILLLFSCKEDNNDKPVRSKQEKVTEQVHAKINGADLEMPDKELATSSFKKLNAMNVNWVGIIPYGYTRKNSSSVNYNYPFQWWGEKTAGVIKTIQLAKEKGLKIMLKPHVWVSGEGWPGEFTCDTEKEWEIWEHSYRDYILTFAKIADSMDVAVFCIGTEYRLSVRERSDFWVELIDAVRKVYSNKITYAANWDNYEKVSFWHKLDYVGIDAYFPITERKHPTSDELKIGFEKLANRLKKFSDSCQKKILFTEYGFRSLDYSTSGYYKHQVEELSSNTELQADAYRTFLSTFWDNSWIKGGFFWKYQFKSKHKLGGLTNNKYTPQYKPAQEVISKYYGKNK